MGLFDRLFGTPEVRLVKRLCKDTQATYAPMGSLLLAIVSAANSVQQDLAQVFGFSMKGTSSEPQVLMFYEFLFFFSHVTWRTAAANSYTEPQIEKLHGYLVPLLASTAVDSSCRHWPEDRKKSIMSEFFENLKIAEAEYSECRGLLSPDDPLDSDTLIGRLAGGVAELWERSADESVKMAVAYAATKAFKGMQLESVLADVAAVIDSVDSELLAKFWKQ